MWFFFSFFSRFWLSWSSSEQLWPSVVFFVWQKDENVLFIRVFIYCEEMEKEGQEAKFTNSPGKEKKRGKLPDFFRSFQLDRRGKWTWRIVTVCVLYLLKRRNTWLNLFHLSCNPTSSKLLCLRLAFTRSLLFHSGFFHSSTSSSPYLILSFWSDTEPFEDKM